MLYNLLCISYVSDTKYCLCFFVPTILIEAHLKSSTFTVSATVLDDDIQRVRFNLVFPDGTSTGFDRGDLIAGGCSGHSCTYVYDFDTTTQSGKYGLRINVQDQSANDLRSCRVCRCRYFGRGRRRGSCRDSSDH